MNSSVQETLPTNVSQADWAQWRLTPREIEIVDLISQGVKPQGIANTLYISLATTYKHLQHIYEKMNVSNNQELMVKLLNPHDTAELLNETE